MFLKPVFASLLVTLAATGVTNAWFRYVALSLILGTPLLIRLFLILRSVPCTIPIVQERIDPILAAGKISQHLHSIHVRYLQKLLTEFRFPHHVVNRVAATSA